MNEGLKREGREYTLAENKKIEEAIQSLDTNRGLKLTAVKYSKAKELTELLCEGNFVTITREENEHDSSGVAYRCVCKGEDIGYLPDLQTLRNYYQDARTLIYKAEIALWGRKVANARAFFKKQHKEQGLEQWTARISKLKYCKSLDQYNEEWLESPNYEGQEGYVLRQVFITLKGGK